MATFLKGLWDTYQNFSPRIRWNVDIILLWLFFNFGDVLVDLALEWFVIGNGVIFIFGFLWGNWSLTIAERMERGDK